MTDNDRFAADENASVTNMAANEEVVGPSRNRILAVLSIFLLVVFGGIGLIAYKAATTINAYYAEKERVAEEEQAKREAVEKQQADIQRRRAEQRAKEKEDNRQKQLAAEAERKRVQEEDRVKVAEQMKKHRLDEIKLQKEREQRRLELARQKLEREKHQKAVAAIMKARRDMVSIGQAMSVQQKLDQPDALVTCDGVAGTQLSWRVHLLPKLGQQSLYRQFHLDEPWDSPHNATLIAKMPAVYGTSPEGKTRFRSFLKLDGDAKQLTQIKDLTDGPEQTALVFFVGEKNAIKWTKPDAVEKIEPVTIERLGILSHEPKMFSFCMHRAIVADNLLHPELVRAYGSPSGGEHFNAVQRSSTPWKPTEGFRPDAAGKPIDTDPMLEKQQALEKLATVSTALNQHLTNLQQPDVSSEFKNSQLSWRVHLLPLLGEEKLYRQFNLNKPWDSPENLKLVASMPDVYKLGATSGRTRLRLRLPYGTPTGPGGVPRKELTDAPELTTLIFFAAPHRATTWTNPATGANSKETLHHFLGLPESSTVLSATLAGTLIEIPAGLHKTKLNALMSISGGENFDLTEALQQAEKPLKRIARIDPPTPIEKLITLPHVKPPADDAETTEIKDGLQLRKIAAAIQNYHNSRRRPPGNVSVRAGKRSELSWRVHILPYLGQKNLYDKFHLNEPWDSEHNQTLFEYMPEIYRTHPDQKSTTGLVALDGDDSLMRGSGSWNSADDGPGNTILMMRVTGSAEQTWTRPDTHLNTSDVSVKGMTDENEEVSVVMGDGSMLRLNGDTPDNVFRALATRDGQEILDAGTLQRWLRHSRGEPRFDAALRDKLDARRLWGVAYAIHTYQQTHYYFPPGIRQRGSRPADTLQIPMRCLQLSWRVHILPFLGHRALYDQFRLEEPWGSPHNKQLISAMPECYRDFDDPADSHMTQVVMFTGPGTAYEEPGKAPTMRDFRDGMHSTIAFVEAPEENAVPWTQPVDIQLNFNEPGWEEVLEPLTKQERWVGFFDAEIQRLRPGATVENLRALITPKGREVLKMRELFER